MLEGIDREVEEQNKAKKCVSGSMEEGSVIYHDFSGRKILIGGEVEEQNRTKKSVSGGMEERYVIFAFSFSGENILIEREVEEKKM